jgi:hypothetical protein
MLTGTDARCSPATGAQVTVLNINCGHTTMQTRRSAHDQSCATCDLSQDLSNASTRDPEGTQKKTPSATGAQGLGGPLEPMLTYLLRWAPRRPTPTPGSTSDGPIQWSPAPPQGHDTQGLGAGTRWQGRRPGRRPAQVSSVVERACWPEATPRSPQHRLTRSLRSAREPRQML